MKRLITVRIDYDLDWKSGASIEKIRKDLDVIEKIGATRVEIDYGTAYGDAYLCIDPIIERLETDEEYGLRTEKEQVRQESIKEIELRTLRELKAKYEPTEESREQV